MSGGKGLLGLGLTVYLLALLWQLPAARAHHFFHKGMPALGQWSELQGTWRQGVAVDGGWGTVHLEELQWRFTPWRLGRGQLAATVNARSGASTLKAMIGRSSNTLELSELDSKLDLAEFTRIFFPGVRLSGVLASQGQVAIRKGRVVGGEGKWEWRQAGVTLQQPLSLGDLAVVLATTPEGVRLTLGDSGGPLQVEGQLLLQGDGRYTLTVTAAGRQPELQKQLDSLALLAKRQPDGRLQFTFSGVVPLLPI